ncbi:MAG: PorP/SprF family type IX secretion system membrane protein [Bacteroidales bacterium]|nr:PorP/SprF family type IX secretion system membrane protein [Bacteroidales bacterium]
MKRIMIISGLIIVALVNAQDPHFSQFYSAPLYLGPSFSGMGGDTRFVLNFRDQWPKLPGAFITSSVSADHYLQKYNSGLGFIYVRDNAGDLLVSNMFGAQYAYDIAATDRLHFIPGIQAAYYLKGVNQGNLTYSDQFYNGEFGSLTSEYPTENTSNVDFTLSLVSYFDNYWMGVTADHLMKLSNVLAADPKYIPFEISTYGGAKFNIKNRLINRKKEESVSFAYLYKTQDRMHQLDLGLYLIEFPMMFGLWYRGLPVFQETIIHDALTFLAGYRFNYFTVGYSYDFTISRLITTTGGAHEISIIYKMSNTKIKTRKRMRALPCPDVSMSY